MKKILLLCITFFFAQTSFAYENVQVPYNTNDTNKLYQDDTESNTPQLIIGSVSLLNSVPQGFFGTWKVISVLVESTDPFLFNSMSVDFWKLEKTNNNLTLSNPESGATATVTLNEVKNNTIKFVRTSSTPYEKITETPEITLNGENFYGTDTIVINKYKNNAVIGKEMVRFKVKGIKQSGASVNDIISK